MTTNFDSDVARAEQFEDHETFVRKRDEAYEQSEKILDELERDAYNNAVSDVVEYTHEDFAKAIQTVLLNRNLKSRTQKRITRRQTSRHVKKVNALSTISDYFHDNLLRVTDSSPIAADQIVMLCNMVVISPKATTIEYKLTNAKNSPTLMFRPLQYIDERGNNLGWNTWAIVIKEKGKDDKVIPMLVPYNEHFAMIHDLIDTKAVELRVSIVCSGVKNYMHKLYSEE